MEILMIVGMEIINRIKNKLNVIFLSHLIFDLKSNWKSFKKCFNNAQIIVSSELAEFFWI